MRALIKGLNRSEGRASSKATIVLKKCSVSVTAVTNVNLNLTKNVICVNVIFVASPHGVTNGTVTTASNASE